jgi:hypothetical protein
MRRCAKGGACGGTWGGATSERKATRTTSATIVEGLATGPGSATSRDAVGPTSRSCGITGIDVCLMVCCHLNGVLSFIREEMHFWGFAGARGVNHILAQLPMA